MTDSEVFEDLEAVRESGLTNVFDSRSVQEVATLMDAEALMDWMADHRNGRRVVGYGDLLKEFGEWLAQNTEGRQTRS